MVAPARYIPERGDAIWITLNPQAGHEQAGRRPAVVLSPAMYNGGVGLMICCPITNQIKGYPFEVILPSGLPVTGTVLSDQVKNLDWRVALGADRGWVGRVLDITAREDAARCGERRRPDREARVRAVCSLARHCGLRHQIGVVRRVRDRDLPPAAWSLPAHRPVGSSAG